MTTEQSKSEQKKPHPNFPDYQVVTRQIYVRPADSPSSIPASSPTVIVLYCWGDSNPKHVGKYTDGYRALYPQARLVVVFGPILKAITQTLPKRSATMAPCVDAIFGGTNDTAEHARERVMVVCMSNTGGINFAATLHAYKARFGVMMPYALLVMDSTPGNPEFIRNVYPWTRAMALGAGHFLPWVPFFIRQTLALVFLAGLHGIGRLTGNQSAARFSVAAINDQENLSVVTAKKLYLYSKGDDIIFWKDIEEQAADARTRGYDVELEMFEGTPHVGHMREHPEQYWNAISKRWAECI
ncbi:hypothetical protein GE09DRAFT_1175098 [Coniochaeta sp. 2T2.1]|nr:hypothetical protein GE09DRAFT_1175098 [Coniochaeta sp. 2T2.1]